MADEGQEAVPGRAEADAALMETDFASEPETVVEGPAETPPGDTDAVDSTAQPRDAEGKFTAEAPDAAPAPEAEGEPETTTAEPPPPSEPDATDTPTPWAFRANGQDVSLPGSEQREDGVFLSQEALPNVQRILSQGVTAQQNLPKLESKWQQRIADSDIRASAAEAKAAQWEAALEKILTDETTRNTVLEDPEGLFQRLKVESDQQALTARESAAQAELTRMRQAEQLRETEPDRSQALSTEIVSIGREAGLTDQEIEVLGPEIWQALWQQPNLWRFATKEEALASNGRATEGQLSMDVQLVRDEMQRTARAAAVLRARQQQAAGKASAGSPPAPTPTPPAPKKNQAPPVASAQGAPTPAASEPVPVLATRAEQDAWFKKTSADEMA